MGILTDAIMEYDRVVKWYAEHGEFPPMVSCYVRESIQSDPLYFVSRVRQAACQKAIERLAQRAAR